MKDAAKLNDKMTAHNERLAQHRVAVEAAKRGEVTGDPFAYRERLIREGVELVVANLELVEARRSLRQTLLVELSRSMQHGRQNSTRQR